METRTGLFAVETPSPVKKHSLSSPTFLPSPPRSPSSDRQRDSFDDGRTLGSEQDSRGGSQQGVRARKTGLSTVYGNVPNYSEDWIFDFDDDPPRKLDVEDIKIELYRRECRNLGVTPVGVYLRSPSSPELSIRHYLLGARGAKALAVPLLLDSCITTLNLERNALGAEGIRHLMEPLTESCCITHLNLSHNDLGSKGAAVMGHVLMNNSLLRCVTLAGNGFRDADADHFVQVLMERKTLKELNLSENELEDGAASKFGNALNVNSTLECLDLSWNHIRPKGGAALFNGVKENFGLKRLHVSHNGLGDHGCAAAASALANNGSLLELDMANNRITNTGLTVLASQLKHNDTLQVLKLGDNLATGAAAQALGEAIFAAEDCAIHTLDLTNISVWDSLIKLVEDRAKSRPLKLVHGKVTRVEVPLEELEQQIKEEIMAAARARDEAEKEEEGDDRRSQHAEELEETEQAGDGLDLKTIHEDDEAEANRGGQSGHQDDVEKEDVTGITDENKGSTITRESTESLYPRSESDVQSDGDDGVSDRDMAENDSEAVTPVADRSKLEDSVPNNDDLAEDNHEQTEADVDEGTSRNVLGQPVENMEDKSGRKLTDETQKISDEINGQADGDEDGEGKASEGDVEGS